jgi:hypothetical protein
MPRNRYTPTIRREERARAAHQEAALHGLARELHSGHPQDAATPAVNQAKARRSARLEQKRLRRLRRTEAATQA